MNDNEPEDEWLPEDVGAKEGATLRHSKRIDVHRWSDHAEVGSLVNELYLLLKQDGNKAIRKKHLKVVLLNLYVNWWIDPTLKTTYSRSPNSYSAGSIYNELHISRMTIDVVDWLSDVGLVETKIGFYNKVTKKGFDTRFWPTDILVKRFKAAKFGIYDLGFNEDRLAVILKDKDKLPVEYELSPHTDSMQADLRRYNKLLHRTFILPHSLDCAQITSEPSSLHFAHQQSKFVYRVFNNSSFLLGGRFYGGWWTNCRKELRGEILIDDHPTIEVDFGSLHPNLLYAREGIDMWAELKDGPYVINPVSFEDQPDRLRLLAKQIMLILLNVEDRNSIPAAFRDRQAAGSPLKKLTNEEVFEVVDQLETLNAPISRHFASGIALELQFIDSKIAARVVNQFVDLNVPVLVVHDSFIVPQGWEEELEAAMDIAFRAETDSDFSSQLKYEGWTFVDVQRELAARLDARHWAKDGVQEGEELELYKKVHPKRTDWYNSELLAFEQWKAETAEQ